MTRFHQDYLRPCQEIDLEIAWRTHPSLVKLYNAATAEADANIAKLVTYQISWAEYVRTRVCWESGFPRSVCCDSSYGWTDLY